MDTDSPARSARYAGFTLMELLVCMLIIGLLFSVGSSMSNALEKARAWQITHQLGSLLNFTRGSAIQYQQEVTLCAVDESGECQRHWADHTPTVFIDKDRDRRHDLNEVLLRQAGRLGATVSLDWRAALARPYIAFKPDGSTNQNGSFKYCPKTDRLAIAIIVNRGGRHYLGGDSNGDGVVEDSRARNLQCDGA